LLFKSPSPGLSINCLSYKLSRQSIAALLVRIARKDKTAIYRVTYIYEMSRKITAVKKYGTLLVLLIFITIEFTINEMMKPKQHNPQA
jgi:hypothetical protein